MPMPLSMISTTTWSRRRRQPISTAPCSVYLTALPSRLPSNVASSVAWLRTRSVVGTLRSCSPLAAACGRQVSRIGPSRSARATSRSTGRLCSPPATALAASSSRPLATWFSALRASSSGTPLTASSWRWTLAKAYAAVRSGAFRSWPAMASRRLR